MDNIWIPAHREDEDAFMEATGEVFWNGYQPIPCPHCGEATLRYFWRQYRSRTQPEGTIQRLGTSWTWCPECHLFYSGDRGPLPEWWPELDPIAEVEDLGPNGVNFDSHWTRILEAIAAKSPQSGYQSSTVSPKIAETSLPAPTERVLYRLLFDALIEIRLLGYESNNKMVWVLADLLHNLPLQLDRLDRGGITVQDIMRELEWRAHRHGIERWLYGRLGEVAKHYPQLLAQDDKTA